MGRKKPDGGFGAEKESMLVLYGPRRPTSPAVSSVEKWWRMGRQGGTAEPHPSRFQSWKVRGFRSVGRGERMVAVGRKGEGNERIPIDTQY